MIYDVELDLGSGWVDKVGGNLALNRLYVKGFQDILQANSPNMPKPPLIPNALGRTSCLCQKSGSRLHDATPTT